MFTGISIVCFATSYTVTLALEITRLFLRTAVRMFLIVGFAIAGLFTHTIYLGLRAKTTEAPLSSWYDWCLMVGWILAAVYLSLVFRRPRSAAGIFILPLILVLIGVAQLFPKDASFPAAEAGAVWGTVHGIALLLGTVAVMIGFATGLMYLIQAYRLKQKRLPRQGLQLPSLEWLQKANESALILSSCLLAVGLLSGMILNSLKHSDALPWTDPVVWTSAVLFLWVVVAALFNRFYKPARQGRKVAYLTVASFLFLALVLAIVLFAPSQHANTMTGSKAQSGGWSHPHSSSHPPRSNEVLR